MKITVIGTGAVGLVSSACLAEIGKDDFCLDVDPAGVAGMQYETAVARSIGSNHCDPNLVRGMGFEYLAIGRETS